MKIRQGTFNDKAKVLKLCEEHYRNLEREQQGKFGTVKWDRARAEGLFNNVIGNPSQLLLVVEHEDEIVGMHYSVMTNYPWNYHTLCHDVFGYIQPKHRRGMIGIKLFKAVEEWAKSKKCLQVQMGYILSNPRMQKFYNRLGYHKVGDTYAKEIR